MHFFQIPVFLKLAIKNQVGFNIYNCLPESSAVQLFLIYQDTNQSGEWDFGEPGIPGVGLTLYSDPNDRIAGRSPWAIR